MPKRYIWADRVTSLALSSNTRMIRIQNPLAFDSTPISIQNQRKVILKINQKEFSLSLLEEKEWKGRH
jgi:hypothetical protein